MYFPFIYKSENENKKPILFSFCFVFVFLTLNSTAQSLKVLWQQCYGGSSDDIGLSVLPSNNGFILFGQSSSHDGQVSGNHGEDDLWVVWIDSTGNYLTSTCYGGSGFDAASQMKACSDGGYVLFGTPFSTNGNITNNHGGGDYWLIKTDKDGNLQWQNCFGGSAEDFGIQITVTSDSGFICSGISSSHNGDVTGNHGGLDYWIIKVDKNGNLKWENSFGGSYEDDGLCASETNDGGMIVGGWTGSTDGNVLCQHKSEFDAWVLKLDSLGNIEWQKCYGGSDMESIFQILPLDDGSYLFLGTTNSNDGDITGNHGAYDYWVGKIDHWGNLLWNRCYGGSEDDDPWFIKRLSDGNYIIGGDTKSNNGDVSGNHSFSGYKDMWIIKISPEGNLIWQQCFGGGMNEVMSDAIELPGSRLLLIGSSFTSNNSGDVQCTHHGEGTYDLWLLMVYDSTMVGIKEKETISDKITVYPNPASDYVKFSCNSKINHDEARIIIENSMGQIIKLIILPAMETEFIWNIQSLSSGFYTYFFTGRNHYGSGKIVIIKD